MKTNILRFTLVLVLAVGTASCETKKSAPARGKPCCEGAAGTIDDRGPKTKDLDGVKGGRGSLTNETSSGDRGTKVEDLDGRRGGRSSATQKAGEGAIQ